MPLKKLVMCLRSGEDTSDLKRREAACSALAVRAMQRRALHSFCGAVAVQRRRRARKAAASAHAELYRQQRCLRAWRRATWAGRRVAALAVLQAVRVQGTVLGAWRVTTVRSRCAGQVMHVRAELTLLMYIASCAHTLFEKLLTLHKTWSTLPCKCQRAHSLLKLCT